MAPKRSREPDISLESDWLGYDLSDIQLPASKRRSLASDEAFSLSSTFEPVFRSTLRSQVLERSLPHTVLPEESSCNLSDGAVGLNSLSSLAYNETARAANDSSGLHSYFQRD